MNFAPYRAFGCYHIAINCEYQDLGILFSAMQVISSPPGLLSRASGSFPFDEAPGLVYLSEITLDRKEVIADRDSRLTERPATAWLDRSLTQPGLPYRHAALPR